MSDERLILESLERAGETIKDPTPLVYDMLFSRRPELEALFVMDTDGGVRGAMLDFAFNCIIDTSGPCTMAPILISAERQNHDAYGVPADAFDVFFEAIRDTIRALNGVSWSHDHEAAWTRLLATLAEQEQAV